MGTLIGHVLPGTFFIVFALWRFVQIIRRQQLLRHYRSQHNAVAAEMFYTSATYPCYFGSMYRWPLEGFAKVVLTGIGVIGEVWASTNYGRARRVVYIGDIQHVTMYCMFFVSGAIDLMVWCCQVDQIRPSGSSMQTNRPLVTPNTKSYSGGSTATSADDPSSSPHVRVADGGVGKFSCRFFRGPLRCCQLVAPPGVDFFALSLAFVIEGLLFSQHTHGKPDVEVLLHQLLVGVVLFTAVSVLVEMGYSRSIAAALLTTFLIFVQGSWFFQVGLVLYPPFTSSFQQVQTWLYSLPSDEQTDAVVVIFCWHLAGWSVLVMTGYLALHKLFAVTGSCCRCCATDPDDVKLMTSSRRFGPYRYHILDGDEPLPNTSDIVLTLSATDESDTDL